VITERNATITGVQGVYFGGSGNDTLDNAGTISGTGGTAVSMGSGDDTTYLRDGSAITGTVKGGNGTDTIYLEGSGTITEGTITAWETIRKSGDGTWSLGGDLSSGKSISVLGGALKVSGVYTHEAGATYTIGAGSNGKVGKITADTAVLNGGAVSVVTKGLKGGTHTIVETTNGLTGTFDSVTSDSKYREMSLAYDAKNSYLNMRSNFKKAGARGTRGNVASAIDDAYSNPSSDDMVTVVDELFTLDDGALNSALDQISGTTHSVSSTVAPARQGAFYQNLFGRTGGTTGLGFLGLNDRETDPLTMLASGGPVASDAGFTLTRDGQKLPYGMWIKGYSVTGNRHGDDVGSRYDYTIGGAIAGFDYLINPNIRAGVAVGYSKTNVDMKQLRDNSDAESWQGAIYGSYVPTSKLWYVDAAFAYSKNSYETKRYLNFGNIYRVARGSYDGSDISGYLEGGYKVPILGGITATPLASFLAMCNHTDSFTETGAGALNLETNSNNTDSYQSGVGVKLSREFKAAKDFTLTPEFGAKWLHEFGDTEANINARFAGETAGSFVITSSTAKRDAGVLSLNLTGKKSDMLNFFIGYDLGLTEDQISHGFTGGLRFNW
jgi:outer membrane autotransporter protein